MIARAPERVAWDYRRLRAYLHERPARTRFERFIETLAMPRTLFLFFTSGLLHFVCKNLEFVPASQPLVLIGAGLTAGEEAWIRRSIPRPFHHIDEHVDDRVVWEFLFETAGSDFGWLDVDCFVQNPALFTDLFTFDRDVALNCVWSYQARGNHRMLCTHLLAVQHAVMRRVRRRVSVSPSVYSFEPVPRAGYKRGCARPPTRSQLRLIERVFPLDGKGRQSCPSWLPEKGFLPFFDTLTMYQLCAEGLGYRLHAVRDLQGTNTLERHFSDEVVHVNAASYYRDWKNGTDAEQRRYRLLLTFDYLLIRSLIDRLPSEYVERMASTHAALIEVGIPIPELAERVRTVFRTRGVGAHVFERDEWRFLHA